MKIKIRSDKKTGVSYLKLSDFRDVLNTRMVDKYKLDTTKETMAITFYDKNGDVIVPKLKGEIAYYNPRNNEISFISYDCQEESYYAESPRYVWLFAGSKSRIIKDTKSFGNIILGEL